MAESPVGEPRKSSIPPTRGGTAPIIYNEAHVRDEYIDEYTVEILQKGMTRDAIEDELTDLNEKVWKLSCKEEMERVLHYILIRSRWVPGSKSDAEARDV